MIVYGSTMLMNVLFNAWLIPTGGYMAAAWITVASEGIVFAVSGAIVLRLLRTNNREI